jgi:hypothetical protein
MIPSQPIVSHKLAKAITDERHRVAASDRRTRSAAHSSSGWTPSGAIRSWAADGVELIRRLRGAWSEAARHRQIRKARDTTASGGPGS